MASARQAATAAQTAAWAAEGVGCSPVSAGSLGYGGQHAKRLRLTARLGHYTAIVTGLILAKEAGIPVWQYASAALTVEGPAGRFQRSLGGMAPNGLERLTPWPVGPSPLDSAMCLVRFPGDPRPTVLFGVGGPGFDLAATWAYVVAVPIAATGLSKPVTDLSPTGGSGLSGQQVVFDHGRPLLVGSNGAFPYAGALTAQPPVVLTFSGGRFVIVTRSHPALVASSAKFFWQEWQRGRPHKPPADAMWALPLVAWAAVACATGHQVSTYRTLSSLEAAGWFNWPGTPPSRGAGFVRTTEQMLVRTGYCVH